MGFFVTLPANTLLISAQLVTLPANTHTLPLPSKTDENVSKITWNLTIELPQRSKGSLQIKLLSKKDNCVTEIISNPLNIVSQRQNLYNKNKCLKLETYLSNPKAEIKCAFIPNFGLKKADLFEKKLKEKFPQADPSRLTSKQLMDIATAVNDNLPLRARPIREAEVNLCFLVLQRAFAVSYTHLTLPTKRIV